MGLLDGVDHIHETNLSETPTSSSAQSPAIDPQSQDPKSKLTPKNALLVAWHGMELLLKKVEGCLDGTPAKGPVAAINALIDLKNAVGDNNEALQDAINQTAERLKAVNKAVNDGVPDAALARMKSFAERLRKEVNELKEMSSKGLLRKLLESEEYNQAIVRSFKQIDEATKTFLLDVAWSTERKVYEIDSDVKKMRLERLLRGRKAIYNADLGGGLTRELCAEGTRNKIREDIIGWAMDSSPDCPSVFWVTGQAGSGKTTIACTIAQYFDRLDRAKDPIPHTILGGSFLCSRQFEETRERIRILPTLVYQLAQKSRSYARALHQADKFDSDDKLSDQMEDLLSGPWQKSEAERHELPPCLVVIDALDEIEGQEGSAFLGDLLKAIDGRYLQGLKFFVTSRPDPDVAELCESLSPKVVRRLQDVPIEDVGSDIVTYLQAKLPKLDRADLDRAARQADGLFISAATVVRYLTPRRSITPREQCKLLDELLSSKSVNGAMQPLLIDELYQHILRQTFSNLPEDLFWARLRVLHTFLCTIERTSTSVTATLLSEPDDEMVNAVLNDLHAVLYCKDGQVLWYHASFPDFVFTRTRSTFELDGRLLDMSCNHAQHHSFLTKSCFEVMKSHLRFNIGDIPSSFIFNADDPDLNERVNTNISAIVKYACRYWASHVGQASHDSDDLNGYIRDFLNIRVLFWIEAMHLLGLGGEGSPMLLRAREFVLKVGQIPNSQSGLSADIAEAANFAIYFAGSPAAVSTPHLYISSLATWSQDSALSRRWRDQFPHIPSFTHLKASDVPLMVITTNVIVAIAFSSDGTRIVSGSWDNSVRVWDASSGAELKVLNGHTERVYAVAFSSDGTRIVSGSWDNSVRVWDASSGAEFRALNGHTDWVCTVAFSSDGTRIFSGSWDNSVRVWDASNGAELKVLNGHTGSVRSVAFSSNGIRIVSGSYDMSVRVWDASSGAELKVLNGHTSAIHCVAFSSDGTRIVSGSGDNSMRVWDASSGAELKVLNGHTDGVLSIAFSGDGTRIASGSGDKSVRVWDTSNGAELKVLNGHTKSVYAVAFSSDGTHIVSGSQDNSMRVWDASREAELKVQNGHIDTVHSVAFSSDGTRIVTGSDDKSVRVWDALNGAELKVLNGHTGSVRSVAFSSNGICIVSGSYDMSVRVWDASSGAELKVLDGHTGVIQSVTFSSDGAHIVSGSWDSSIRVWDALSGTKLKVIYGHTNRVSSVAFSGDGAYIVSGSWDESVRVWDALSGAELKVLNGHTNAVCSVAFSSDGTQIVSGSWDESVRVWDTSSGAELRVLNGHTNAVYSVAFSSDGTQIVSGSRDKSVRVWDALSWAELKVLNGHIDEIFSVAFSSDGTRIVSGSADCSVRVSVAEPLFSTWTCTQDNWVITLPGRDHLMWVPQQIPLFLPYTVLVISPFGSASINFHHCKIGHDWAGCYVPG